MRHLWNMPFNHLVLEKCYLEAVCNSACTMPLNCIQAILIAVVPGWKFVIDIWKESILLLEVVTHSIFLTFYSLHLSFISTVLTGMLYVGHLAQEIYFLFFFPRMVSKNGKSTSWLISQGNRIYDIALSFAYVPYLFSPAIMKWVKSKTKPKKFVLKSIFLPSITILILEFNTWHQFSYTFFLFHPIWDVRLSRQGNILENSTRFWRDRKRWR